VRSRRTRVRPHDVFAPVLLRNLTRCEEIRRGGPCPTWHYLECVASVGNKAVAYVWTLSGKVGDFFRHR
jgi:hypothetical protein